MPHLIIEYSKNLVSLEIEACLAAANSALAATGHFEEVDIKSRAYATTTFRVGLEATGRAFVAARLSVLSGRSLEIKQDLSQILLRTLRPYVASSIGLEIQLSVEVFDIERQSYAKTFVEA